MICHFPVSPSQAGTSIGFGLLWNSYQLMVSVWLAWYEIDMIDIPDRNDMDFVGRALDALNIGVWSWTGSPANVRCCPVAARMFGVADGAALAGLPLDQYAARIHPDDQERFKLKIARAQRVGGSFLVEYRTNSTHDGVRSLLDRGEFQLGPTGHAIAARGILVDLTDLQDREAIKGNAFFRPGFQKLQPMERAVEHALALHELIGAMEGDAGREANVHMKHVLFILAQEIIRLVKIDEPSLDAPSCDRLH